MATWAERVIQAISKTTVDFSMKSAAETRAWMDDVARRQDEARGPADRRGSGDPTFEAILTESGLDRRAA